MEVTKKDVEKLIELRKENTFLNHFWNVFSRDFRLKGEIGRNEIKVWKQNMWNATFYPIFTFEFNANNHLKITFVSTKLQTASLKKHLGDIVDTIVLFESI